MVWEKFEMAKNHLKICYKKSSENLSTIIGRPYKCRYVITKKRCICKLRWNAIGLNHQIMKSSFSDDSKTFNFKIRNKT